MNDVTGAPTHATAWPNLTACVSNDCTWIHNHGTRWPGSNVFSMINRWEQLETTPELEGSKSKDEPTRTIFRLTGVETHGSLLTCADDEDDLSTNSAEPLEFDRKDVINYLYPPTAVRTQVQKRTQMLLLQVSIAYKTASMKILLPRND